MALVRISKQLHEDVKHHVKVLASAERTEIPGVSDELSDTGPGPRMVADAVLWGEHLHLRDQMPDAWMKTANAGFFHTRHVHPDGQVEVTSSIQCPIVGLRLPPGAEIQYNYSRGVRDYHVSVHWDFDDVRAVADDANDPRHALAARIMDMVRHEQAVRALQHKWDQRLRDLTQFLNKCKSLNEAVKLWPGVRLYVPKNYLEQLDTPVVRPQAVVRKERALENVDTDDLTAAAVAARLQGLV